MQVVYFKVKSLKIQGSLIISTFVQFESYLGHIIYIFNLTVSLQKVRRKRKQVAQRATIAHLSPMCQHPLISNKPASKVIKNLNSFQIREQLFFSGLSTSNVSRLKVPEIKPLVVFKHALVTKEQASMETSLSHYNSLEYFSNTQGPLIPQ